MYSKEFNKFRDEVAKACESADVEFCIIQQGPFKHIYLFYGGYRDRFRVHGDFILGKFFKYVGNMKRDFHSNE